MVKKISVLALAGLIAFPAMSMAGGSGKGGAANVDDLERKIEELSRQLDELKAQMGKQGEVDAGILPRLYGDLNEKKFNVKKTTIIVRLSELRFAALKSSNRKILAVIDTHLQQLKAESDSLYFQSVSRWLGQQDKKADFDLNYTPEERAWLTTHGRILLGVDPEFVPFEFIDVDGSYRGMCADYVNLISERTGVAMDIAQHFVLVDG